MRKVRLFYPNLQEKHGDHKLAIRDAQQLDRLKVLRAGRLSYDFVVTDGLGAEASVELLQLTKDGALFQLKEDMSRAQMSRRVILLLPVIKLSNLELAIKLTSQLNFVAEIRLYSGDFSQMEAEKMSPNKIERLHKISIAALCQSHSSFLPEINLHNNLSSAISNLPANNTLVVPDTAGQVTSISDLNLDKSIESVSVVIGPEGGFSPAEREILAGANMHRLSLGDSVLSTEAAAHATLILLKLAAV